MLWLYRFLKGFLKIKVVGENSEQILNIAASNRIPLWKSKIIKNGIESEIYISDFKKLPYIVRKTGLKIHIIKKSGLPIWLAKNRKRTGFIIGGVYLLAFLQIMSGYIWEIDIVGNHKVTDEKIITALKKIGIESGIKASALSPKIDREKLLLELDELSWASLNIEGSRLTVNVSERNNVEKQDKLPVNLKAGADGIVKKINVTVGNCIVKAGDTVKKGDILVSGIIEDENGTRFVKSAGSIIAEITDEYTVEKSFEETITQKNGKTKTKYVLEAFTLKVPLYLGSEKNEYISTRKTVTLKLFKKNLPIKIHKKTFDYTDKVPVKSNHKELENELKNILDEQIKKNGLSDYTIIQSELTPTSDGLSLKMLVRGTTDIGISEQMLIN